MVNKSYIGASIDIAASPAEVWAVVSDLRRMGEWSPQCRKMFIKGGVVQRGTSTVNINRQGPLVWPTRSVVTEFVPEQRLQFVVRENKTRWTFELEATPEGTRLTESRTTPKGVSDLSNLLTRRVLGGTERFEDGLQSGIHQTLRRIKDAAEAR
ncbi:SRPBCC family protein [Aeromicrobium sp. YIM 150415]|uniref:SRPBCC family protein n=1 Tax=Aeromicrobium sp. YIM 150415 TaxID=2803912 RepID=UPI001963CC33|nr:SRPBCC family protein [Aeromicrobium sp. YIM 150415]MBM9463271.1 SRPBCC family protein [Aeromicrobium sp. YIM 150415]